MMSLPGLLIAPILAFIVLILFLAFWVLVVVCIATASAPGQNPFAPFDNSAAHRLPPSTGLTIRNNTEPDFKSKYFQT